MKNRFKFILYLFVFALITQSFYPAYIINVNMVEIVENAEEHQKNFSKKNLFSDSSSIKIFPIFWETDLFSAMIVNHDFHQKSVYLDIIVPPPRA